MTVILFILSVLMWFLIGRVVMVIMDKRGWIEIWNKDYSYANPQITFGALFFPLVSLWTVMRILGDKIIEKLMEDFE